MAEPNTVLLFDPERPHRITHPTDEGDDCTALRFSREQIAEAFGAERSSRHWTLDGDSQIALHLQMHRIRNAADALEGEEAAMAILRMLARTENSQTSLPPSVELLRERIAANPGERATLAELASGTGLSPFELARRFRAVTGSSIHQYRLRLRVLVALSRLQDGDDDITTIALDLGFANHAHFTSTFARALKRPPRTVRPANGAILKYDAARYRLP